MISPMAKPATLVMTLLSLFLVSGTFAISYDHDPLPCMVACRARFHPSSCKRVCGIQISEDAGNDLSRDDPEQQLKKCQKDCRQRQPDDMECQRRCEQQYEEQTKQRNDGGEREQQPQKCRNQCRRQRLHQRECEQWCEQQYKEQTGQGGGDDDLSREDPIQQLKQCQKDCRQRQPGNIECQRHCKQQYEEQTEQGHGDGEMEQEDPKQQLQKCRHQCRQHHHHQSECEQWCKEQYKEQTGQGGGDDLDREVMQMERNEEQVMNNPYFFDEQSFNHRVWTEEGNIRVLKRFSRQSKLLQGIDNYRLVILEANPNTFIIPNHWDAEEVLYVVRGRGTISFLKENNKEVYNISKGDILRIPAGTTVFLINRDNNEKLCVAHLLQPVSIPGRYKEFFGAGGEDPESFYRSFSNDVLEAAFKTPRDRLEKLFGQQRKGAIIRASQEQIRAIERHASSSSSSHELSFEEWKGPFNLLNKKPTHSNKYGELHEANADDYKQLQDVDVQVSFANISRGAMHLPFYNSKATKVVWVEQGRGYFEMTCPHLSNQRRQSEEGRGQEQEEEQQHEGHVSYQRVRSRLSPNTVFVVPAGHPVVTVASRDENLQMVCFEINARDNQKYYLAGKKNIMRQMEREEKELSFNVPAREVEKIFNAQGEDAFAPGPEQRQEREEGRSHWLFEPSMIFVGF
ncbi:vicilin Cor a 11.0101-like isoform X1 [Magnolia sinica]|uniref:vicilin Cor a 11.0101-like isoform X1 n=1 Tax=Magnolia sinica TaxID=86752 RepID=UPI00265885C9|nr:vicilin Cor a 11.0101-like isoform X1 [Magnolia sinica]